MEQKKILMAVCNYFDPDNRVYRAADCLQDAGFEVRLLAYHREGLAETEKLASGFLLFRIRMKPLMNLNSKISNLFKYLIFKRKAKRFAREFKPDVVHCHDYNTLFLGIYCKKKFASKLVYDNHEYFQDLNYIHRYPMFVRKRIAAFERKALKNQVDQLIVVSPGIAKLYHPFFNGKISLVRNIPNLEFQTRQQILPEDVADFLKKQAGENRKLLLYLGTNSQRGRGMDFAFNLLKSLPDEYGMVVFGAKNQSELDFLEQKYGDLEAKNRFKAFKSLTHRELMTVSAYCYMGLSLIEPIYLSYQFSLPNKLFEYLMMNLPILSSDIPDQKALIEAYKIGIAVPFEVETAAKLLMNYQVDPERIQAAKAVLCWSKEKENYLNVYADLGMKANFKN